MRRNIPAHQAEGIHERFFFAFVQYRLHAPCFIASVVHRWFGLQAISDGLIALAYLLIPLGLLRLLQKRRDMVFHWLFLLFALFILSCGATHVLGIVTLWIPIYRFDTLVKAITAVASIATAFLLIRLLPKIAKLPSPDQWRLSNEVMVAEISQRKKAEASLLLPQFQPGGAYCRTHPRTRSQQRHTSGLDGRLGSFPTALSAIRRV